MASGKIGIKKLLGPYGKEYKRKSAGFFNLTFAEAPVWFTKPTLFEVSGLLQLFHLIRLIYSLLQASSTGD